MASKIDYTFDSTKESQAQYLARTQPASSGGSSTKTDPFISTLQDKLMSQSDMISSANTGIEDKINQAIGGIKKSTESSSKAIESSYNRQIGYAADAGQNSITGALDSRSGFATNIVALRNLVQTTDKNVNDLEQRKQELILQNDSAGASKMADLQIQGLQFKQQAQQQVFSNLLSMGNFALQTQAGDRADRQLNLSEQQAVSSVALQFGVAVQPGDTIESITTRAAPYASEKQQLELQKIRADINQSNASAAAALASAKASGNPGTNDIDVLASAFLSPNGGPAILGTIKDANVQAAVIAKADQMQNAGYEASATQDKADGTPMVKSIASVTNNKLLNAQQQAAAIKAIHKVYGNEPTPAKANANKIPAFDPSGNPTNYFAKVFLGK